MNRPAKPFPWTLEEVRSLIHYCPETGLFTRNGKPAGSLRKDGHCCISVKPGLWLSHRVAWFWMTGEQIPQLLTVDHKNRIRNDNRWENLRLANPTEQVQNRACVEFKAGYYFASNINRWLVRSVTKDEDGRRKTHCFGEFTCEERAKAAAAIMKDEMNSRIA